MAQKSQLKELIESRSHICDFYPKYHCELNFIEQFWGAAKSRYHVAPRAKTAREMEKTVRECLDSVPLLHIRWSVFFFLAHSLTGLQIKPCVLLLLTGRDCRVHKRRGRIKSTMGTTHYHPRASSKQRTP